MSDWLAARNTDPGIAEIHRFKLVQDCEPHWLPKGIVLKGIGRTPDRDMVLYLLVRSKPGVPAHFTIATYDHVSGNLLRENPFFQASVATSFARELCDAPIGE